jgi:hypothetical protein
LPEDSAHITRVGIEFRPPVSRARRSITLIPYSSCATRRAPIATRCASLRDQPGTFGRRCLDLLYRMVKMRVSAVCAASIVSSILCALSLFWPSLNKISALPPPATAASFAVTAK